MKIKITGGSDDLVEVTGGIQEEWTAPKEVEGDGAFISVSDGTLLRIRYDKDGIWRIDHLVTGKANYFKVEGSVEEDTFDVVTLDGDIRWVALASGYAGKDAK